MLYQQGDILIEKVDSVPSGGRDVSPINGRFILAEGEVTGHVHAVLDDIQLTEVNGRVYCTSNSGFTVQHDEHHSLEIPRGIFRVRRVLEYDHFIRIAEEVED